MSNIGNRLTQTTQDAIHAYSMEGLRLQSRMLLTPKNDPQLQEAKKQTLGVMSIKSKLEEYHSNVKELNEQLSVMAKNLGVTSY